MFRRKLCAAGAVGLLTIGAVAAGCTSAPLTDAREILAKTQESYKNLRSVHFRIDAVGQALYGFETVVSPTPDASASMSPSSSASASVSASASASPSASASATPAASASPSGVASASAEATPSPTPSPTPAASSTPLPSKVIGLDGAYAEGDIDMANKTAHLTGTIPSLPGFNGEMLIAYDMAYIRKPGEAKYMGQSISELALSPIDSGSIKGVASMVGSVLAVAADKRLNPQLVGMEDVLGDTCYHVRVTVTPTVVNEKLGLGGTALGNGALDVWATQDGFNMRLLEFRSSDPTAGSVAIRLTLSSFNEVEPISAPDPKQFEIPALQSYSAG